MRSLIPRRTEWVLTISSQYKAKHTKWAESAHRVFSRFVAREPFATAARRSFAETASFEIEWWKMMPFKNFVKNATWDICRPRSIRNFWRNLCYINVALMCWWGSRRRWIRCWVRRNRSWRGSSWARRSRRYCEIRNKYWNVSTRSRLFSRRCSNCRTRSTGASPWQRACVSSTVNSRNSWSRVSAAQTVTLLT